MLISDACLSLAAKITEPKGDCISSEKVKYFLSVVCPMRSLAKLSLTPGLLTVSPEPILIFCTALSIYSSKSKPAKYLGITEPSCLTKILSC